MVTIVVVEAEVAELVMVPVETIAQIRIKKKTFSYVRLLVPATTTLFIIIMHSVLIFCCCCFSFFFHHYYSKLFLAEDDGFLSFFAVLCVQVRLSLSL